MSLRRLSAVVIVVDVLGLGVFFAFLIGAVVAQGGTATITLTTFGEQWVEYYAMLALTAVTPYALYVVNEEADA